jgi:hypothetical protein
MPDAAASPRVEPFDRDREHLRLLKWGYYIMACFTGLWSVTSVVLLVIGLVIASGAIPLDVGLPIDLPSEQLWIAALGVVYLVVVLTGALLAYFAGRSLRDCHNRVFCMVVAGLCCLQVPWGTVIGVCTIQVLSRPSVKALFEPTTPQTSPHPLA